MHPGLFWTAPSLIIAALACTWNMWSVAAHQVGAQGLVFPHKETRNICVPLALWTVLSTTKFYHHHVAAPHQNVERVVDRIRRSDGEEPALAEELNGECAMMKHQEITFHFRVPWAMRDGDELTQMHILRLKQTDIHICQVFGL